MANKDTRKPTLAELLRQQESEDRLIKSLRLAKRLQAQQVRKVTGFYNVNDADATPAIDVEADDEA